MVGIEAEVLDQRQNQFSEDDNGNGEQRSWNCTGGCCLEEPKKRRGRPLGSKNRAKAAAAVTVGDYEGAARPIALNLPRGCNIVFCIGEFSKRNDFGISILTARGSVFNVKIQTPSQGGVVQPPRSLGGNFELKKLCGSFMPPMWNLPSGILSATLEGLHGQVTGDIFADNLWAAGPVTIVVTRLANPVYLDIGFSQDDNDGAHYGHGIGNMHLPVALSSSSAPSAAHYTCPPNHAAHHNNGFPLASLASHANVHPTTTLRQPARMNNDYLSSPTIGFLPNFSNSSFNSTLISLPSPANGRGYFTSCLNDDQGFLRTELEQGQSLNSGAFEIKP